MKKIIVLAILCVIVLPTSAQLYLGLNTGYGIGVNGRGMGDFILVDAVGTVNGDVIAQNNISSFGGGLSIGPVVGFRINNFVGLEIKSSYHRTNKVAVEGKNYNSPDGAKTDMSGSLWNINPNLVGHIYDGSIDVYSKVGFIYSSGSYTYNREEVYSSEIYSYSYKLKNGNATGLTFALGLIRELKEKLSISAEINYMSANYYPRNGELIKNIENGVDLLPTTDLDSKNISYLKTGSTYGEYYGSAFGDGNVLRPQIPMNGFGLSIGLICTFSNRSATNKK